MPVLPSEATLFATLLSRRVVSALNKRGLADELDPICRSYATTLEDVCGPSRTQNVVRARHAIWCHLRHREGSVFSYPELGNLFERDHTTVMAGVRTHLARAKEATESGKAVFVTPDRRSTTDICAA